MNTLELIKASMWGHDVSTVSREVFEELKIHAIAALPATVLLNVRIDKDLREEWQTIIIQQITNYAQYTYEQACLPITVPYVILKGTSAAQYYPFPEYRTMGDIDIMTRREDFAEACATLIENGYVENTSKIAEDFGRHRGFIKNGIEVEVHSFFALLNDPEKARCLDDLIIHNITTSHVLPDPINGLTLLEHISQHLEGGLGLRQIIDWMMFVDKCLSDTEWPEFSALVNNIGLEKLAIVATQMCVTYLGLPQRTWCAGADKTLCKQLLDYVLACGNFGGKRRNEIATNVFTYARTPLAGLRLLQERGSINWKAARKYRILRPFAWIYQAGRYMLRGFRRDEAVSKVKKEYRAAKKRIKLFDSLGVKQTAKGLAKFEDGYYVKTFQKP